MNPKSPSSTFAVVVNDDPTQLNVLSGLIRKAGLEPCAFTSAEAALTEMSDWSGTKTMDHKALPALIVTDLYMPGIDGWRFCRLLRSAEYAVLNQIPILVVSATFAGGEADRIADDLGAEAFLPSPVDGKQFLKQVEAILSGKRERIPLRVLIVEDSQTLSELLQKAFNSQGYQADTAFTIQAARDAFWKTAYDVALLDYHLPDGAGDTLLDAFRVQRPDCVCLMMTTDTGPELALDWMKRGAAAYLLKPFQPGYLIELCARARRERALLHVQDLLELRTRELRESKEKYRILLEESPDPIFSFSPEGHYTYVNQSFARGVGKPVEDIIGKRIWDIFSKEEADKRFASLNQVFQTGEEKVIEVTVPRADHDCFYMTTITPIKDAAGNVVSAICSSKNITERKLAEQERSLSLQRTQALLQLNQMAEATQQEVTDFALEEAVRLTQSAIGYLAFLNDDESVLTMHSWSNSAMAECSIADKPIIYPVETTGLWGEAVRQRRPVITNDYAAAGSLKKGYPEGHVVVKSHMNIPVFVGSRIVLVAGVGNKAKGYNQDDVQQLTLLMEGMWRLIERKQAEAELLREQLHMKTLLDSLPGIFYLYSYPALRLVRWNKNHETLLGFGPGEIKDRPILEWHIPEAKDAVIKAVEVVMEKGQNMIESPLLTKGGDLIPFLLTGVKLEVPGQSYLMGVGIDISERNRAVEALRESEKKYRLIAENTADLISILDMNLRFTYVSPASMRLRGFTVEEAMAQTLEQALTPESMKIAFSVFEEEMLLEASGTADPDRTLTLELEEYKKDGSTAWMEVSLSFLRDKDRKPVEILIVSRDITDRKRAEVGLRESEEKFRLTYSSSPDAVNINRLEDGLYVDINEGFTRATGYTREEVIGRTSLEMNIWHDPADRQKLVQGLQEKGYYENLEAQFRRKDGSLITALMSARVISLKGVLHIISITRDITESKVIEAKLQQAQKFDAIGTLAGGIAHDFNNLLMGIQGRASLISWDLELSHPHREHIHAIEEYIRSATSLTQQLLGFAKGGKYEVTPVDMNELVHGSSVMFGRTKKEIRIHTKCQKSPLVVEADRGQIEQVLLNMYVNAWQAMPSEGGELYLETKIVTLDQAYCKPHQTEPGPYVKVSITDTGTGMDEATRLRIFDPFFTTKERGRGTGLGLASAYGIIKNHNGMITVYSEIGHGSTFNIYLPLSNREAHREAPREAGPVKGSETILLVDDEELIIDVGQAMLERLGYRVVVCRGGKEAIRVITDMGNEIELVILDMIMPGMDGGTTFDRIREIQPEMPVILSSGYAINGKASEIMRRGCNGFIQKPYNISELSNKIHNVLYERKN
jgi:PAS domain S-box-containing protein